MARLPRASDTGPSAVGLMSNSKASTAWVLGILLLEDVIAF